jgi:Leucine-rich repeat (LRR) protein
MNTLSARIGELNHLETLNLDGNKFTILPEEIKALKKLKFLKLRNNALGEEEKERIKKLLPDCEVSFDY